jgi:hypothetical protein
MQTLRARVRWPMLSGLVGGLAMLVMCTEVLAAPAARVASDEAAGLVIFPKIIIDTSGVFTGGVRLDTVVQLTNVSSDPNSLLRVNCWYVSGNRVCDNDPTRICLSNSDCVVPGVCQAPTCAAADFQVTLTPGQPLAWRVSDPPAFLPCDPDNPNPPNGPAGCPRPNEHAAIPLTEDPFRGELKCVEVDDGDAPVARNDLMGQATIYMVSPGDPNIGLPPLADSAAYSAIGVQASTAAGANDGDAELLLGSEYAGCPGVLILDNFFEGATSPINADNRILTELTLVPCTEDLTGATAPVTTAAQMLIYNEFEQRFSSSRKVSCFDSIDLGDIDTRPGFDDNVYSIFAIGTQGTLTGQTRIRGVETTEAGLGHGLLGVAQEFHLGNRTVGSAAFNLNYVGSRSQVDVLTLTLPR